MPGLHRRTELLLYSSMVQCCNRPLHFGAPRSREIRVSRNWDRCEAYNGRVDLGARRRGGSVERLALLPLQQSLLQLRHMVGFWKMPLPLARIERRWEGRASMSFVADGKRNTQPLAVRKDKESVLELPLEMSQHSIMLNQARTESPGSQQLLLKDSDTNGHVIKSNTRVVKDDVAFNISAPVLRAKSTIRLPRNAEEGSNGETHLLLGEESVGTSSEHKHSFRDEVEHAAAETLLLTRLTLSLLRYLGVRYRWITKFLALTVYGILLMPGFLQVGYKYFFSKHVHRSIVYGDKPRNRLDLYVPDNTSVPKPVVIFVTGGAWIIGYKAWGALLGLQLLQRDIIVCCIDYRNFPQGGVSDMVEDVSNGISFVVNNIAQYGGDPDKIYLAGQSAGSHLASCALVHQARIEKGQSEGTSWKCSELKGFLGISGGYNLFKLVDHFHNRGLDRSLFLNVMEGEISLPRYSPELIVQKASFTDCVHLLPPIHLFHGTADYSIPYDASVDFGDALSRVGATVTTRLYSDKTHTDVFLQDPLRGGRDVLFEDILAVIHSDDEEAKAKDAQAPLQPRLVPEFLLQLAHRISPF